MVDCVMSKRTRIEESFEIKLTGADIINLVNQERKAQGIHRDSNVPADAEVEFHVPGGGDWSNESVGIDEGTPVTIRWKRIETTEE